MAVGILFSALGGDYPRVGAICATVYALGIFAIWLVKETTDENDPDATPPLNRALSSGEISNR